MLILTHAEPYRTLQAYPCKQLSELIGTYDSCMRFWVLLSFRLAWMLTGSISYQSD
jgi:hypothetical protein